jgi:hypothetical protein
MYTLHIIGLTFSLVTLEIMKSNLNSLIFFTELWPVFLKISLISLIKIQSTHGLSYNSTTELIKFLVIKIWRISAIVSQIYFINNLD